LSPARPLLRVRSALGVSPGATRQHREGRDSGGRTHVPRVV